MENTGYIINPYVKQVFTSGPSSGSIVSSSYVITFNTSSNFTSSILCGTIYEYKIFDTINCPITGFCISPTLLTASVVNCSDLNYNYLLTYNINGLTSSISSSVIEYSLNPSFTPSFQTTHYNLTDYINTSSLSLNGDLPLNKNQYVFFRIKNNCINSGSSLYSNALATKCTPYTSSYVNVTNLNCEESTFTINGLPNEVLTLQKFRVTIDINYNYIIKDTDNNSVLYSNNQNSPNTENFPITLNSSGIRRISIKTCSNSNNIVCSNIKYRLFTVDNYTLANFAHTPCF